MNVSLLKKKKEEKIWVLYCGKEKIHIEIELIIY